MTASPRGLGQMGGGSRDGLEEQVEELRGHTCGHFYLLCWRTGQDSAEQRSMGGGQREGFWEARKGTVQRHSKTT